MCIRDSHYITSNRNISFWVHHPQFHSTSPYKTTSSIMIQFIIDTEWLFILLVINGLSIGSWKGKIDLWCAMFHYTLDMPSLFSFLSIETIVFRTDNRTWNLVRRENASTLLNKPFYGIIPFLSWKLYISPNAAILHSAPYNEYINIKLKPLYSSLGFFIYPI